MAVAGTRAHGKVGERFYEQKSVAWREEQKDLLQRLEKYQDASQSYMDEGIALMEPAQRAADLFAEQTAIEKRRLLEFVLSNSFWAHGTLTPEFRQPFDMLADMATVGAQKMATAELTSSHHQEEFRLLDTFRTFLHSPTLEFRIQYQAFLEGASAA